MKRFAILGHPVSHSRSPEFHNAVFQALGLADCRYEYCDTTPDDLEALMQEFREGDYAGFSVTIPHKQAVMQYCDELSERAQKVGACNTLLRVKDKEGGQELRIYGENTDYGGFEKSLEEAGVFTDRDEEKRVRMKALVMGAGGAAKAIVAVLVDHGCEVVVASRNAKQKFSEFSNFQNLELKAYEDLDPQEEWGMIVNCTPIGMQSSNSQVSSDKLLLEDSRWYVADRVYVDIVYTPKMTPFLLKAQEAGGQIVTGDRMFFWQAVEQAKLFTGADEAKIVEVMASVLTE